MKGILKSIFNRQGNECRLNQSIDHLTLSDFFRCMHDGETREVLTISGQPSEEQVIAAWKNVLYDFEAQTNYTFIWAEIWLRMESQRLQQGAKDATDTLNDIEAIRGYRITNYLPREFFDRNNRRLADFFRTQIDINKITVREWIDLMNEYFIGQGIGIR